MDNNKEQIESFNQLIERLKGEIKLEKKYNPHDCDKISWHNQHGILISVVEAELLVKIYNLFKED